MSKIEIIKAAMTALTPEEMDHLREWFDELGERRFDDQIERDEKAGKLEKLAERGRENLRAGRVRDL